CSPPFPSLPDRPRHFKTVVLAEGRICQCVFPVITVSDHILTEHIAHREHVGHGLDARSIQFIKSINIVEHLLHITLRRFFLLVSQFQLCEDPYIFYRLIRYLVCHIRPSFLLLLCRLFLSVITSFIVLTAGHGTWHEHRAVSVRRDLSSCREHRIA